MSIVSGSALARELRDGVQNARADRQIVAETVVDEFGKRHSGNGRLATGGRISPTRRRSEQPPHGALSLRREMRLKLDERDVVRDSRHASEDHWFSSNSIS